jgi:hypothetical protein
MTTNATQEFRKESKRVTVLVTQIRARIDGGHYDFMSWRGRANLRDKLDEYERYANEPHRSVSIMGERVVTERKMETELRSILNYTY